MRVGGEGFPGLDAELVIAKVYVVCPLGGWGGGYGGAVEIASREVIVVHSRQSPGGG